MTAAQRLGSLLFLLTAAGLCLAILTGCEDTPSTEDTTTYFDNHPFPEEPRNQTATDPVTVFPPSVDMGPGRAAGFTASGGNGPFTWTVSIPGNGTVQVQQFTRQAIYTHLGTTNDINSVIATDANGRIAVASIN
jgi:hypothetical protein